MTCLNSTQNQMQVPRVNFMEMERSGGDISSANGANQQSRKRHRTGLIHWLLHVCKVERSHSRLLARTQTKMTRRGACCVVPRHFPIRVPHPTPPLTSFVVSKLTGTHQKIAKSFQIAQIDLRRDTHFCTNTREANVTQKLKKRCRESG